MFFIHAAMIDSLISQCSRGQYWLRFPYHGQEPGWSVSVMDQLSHILLPLAFSHCPKHTKLLQEKIMEKKFPFKHCRRINSFQMFCIRYSSMLPIIKKCHHLFAFQQRINYFELCELTHKKPAFPWVGHTAIWNKINLIKRNTGIFKIN